MSISIPQPFRTRVEGPIGPVSVSGIPSSFTITVASPLPKVSVGVDPLKIGVDPLNTDSRVRLEPVGLSVSIEKIPDVRAHLPANFSLNLCVLGIQLFSIRLCGEAQVITEPYRPNPCERCAEERR